MREWMRAVCLVALVVALAAVRGWGDQTGIAGPGGEAPPNALSSQTGLLSRLVVATEAQREQLGRYINDRCPNLAADIIGFMTQEAPESLSVLEDAISELIGTRHEGLEGFIGQELQATPELKALVSELVTSRYPTLPAELGALPEGAGRAEAARALIATRYPRLISDILDALKQQRPALLSAIQQRVVAKFPGLIADVTTLVLRRYPGLTLKLIAFLRQRYPALLPALIAILSSPPAAAPPTAPDPSTEPADPCPLDPSPAPAPPPADADDGHTGPPS